MKVVIINGSPHPKGNTYDMLNDIIEELHKEDIETEYFWIGNKAVHGCIACGHCNKTHRCIFKDDIVNEVIDTMQTSDGLIIGSPVYYASPNGALLAIMDRMFYAGKDCYNGKPAAGCVVARRAGTTSALSVMEKYFTKSEMPVISGDYWSMEYGKNFGETRQDQEGVYVIKLLAKNMAWILRAIRDAKERGNYPSVMDTDRPWTHFIR